MTLIFHDEREMTVSISVFASTGYEPGADPASEVRGAIE